MTRTWLLGSVVAILACSDSDPKERERSVYEDEGAVCVRSVADGKLTVTVVFPTCLSSSCDRALGTSCTVALSGSELVVTSRGETESTGARECTADCGSLVARCDVTGVPPGSYTLVHGTSSEPITVPATGGENFGDSAPFDACRVN
jgi:hypothetical protein